MAGRNCLETSQNPKTDRNQANRNILTGRVSGKFYQDGQPRGGQKNTKVVYIARQTPQDLTLEEVFQSLGIADSQSQVQNVSEDSQQIVYEKKTIFLDPLGRQQGVVIEPITQKQYEEFHGDIVR